MPRKLFGRFAVLVALAMLPALAEAQTFYTGPPIQFTKPAFADPTLPENQDRITSSAWITRAVNQGLYNAALETDYTLNVSPVNTRWAPGSIADGVGTLTFTDWRTAVEASPPAHLFEPFVLHIVDADIYIDVSFVFWGVGFSGGGAFSYMRSTPSVPVVPSLSGPAAAVLSHAILAAARVARRR
jgi:hypothetical protein